MLIRPISFIVVGLKQYHLVTLQWTQPFNIAWMEIVELSVLLMTSRICPAIGLISISVCSQNRLKVVVPVDVVLACSLHIKGLLASEVVWFLD